MDGATAFRYYFRVTRLRETVSKFNIAGTVLFDEPLSAHTSFRVGGPADAYIVPQRVGDVSRVVAGAGRAGLPLFVLGGGANILVSDLGVRGIVLDLRDIRHIEIRNESLIVGAGYPMSEAAEYAADRGFAGPDFLYAMPGSVGGSVWMNARCYGTSISDVLRSVQLVEPDGSIRRYEPDPADFAYKKSPFQTRRAVIYEAVLALKHEPADDIRARMRKIEDDRRVKGHFDAPSAGSVFKNNRAFGRPTGKIVDDLGLKGFSIGGARISPLHGNIIVNTGSASASDILALIRHVESVVERETGLILEREVIPVGQWPEETELGVGHVARTGR